jgi:uncharacterized protein (TIGR02145 family)
MKRIFVFSLFLVLKGALQLFAQSACDTVYIPRGIMYPPERRELCQNDTIVLQGMVSSGNFQGQWFRDGQLLQDENQEILTVTQQGVYSYRLKLDTCFSSTFDTVRIRFRNQPRPRRRTLSADSFPSLVGRPFVLRLQNTLNSSAISYSWYRSGILENGKSDSLVSRNPGRFRVRIDSAGCHSFSNTLNVNPPGAYKPAICAAFPLEPNGLRVEWVPPPASTALQYRIYRKRYLESVFNRLDTASPAAGFWQSSSEQNLTAYDVVMTASVNGSDSGSVYETEPSSITSSIFLRVDGSGFPECSSLRWSAFEGFEIPRYYIFRNDQLLDSVSGKKTQYQDCNPVTNAVYRVEAGGTENCANSVTDIDGNVYQTVIIGTQEWMKENLKVSKYRNGDTIMTGLDSTSWSGIGIGAFSIYKNSNLNDSIYGKLYNWYAVDDQRSLCPIGWHIPSDSEWKILETFLGMTIAELDLTGYRGENQNIGGKLILNSALWSQPFLGATNQSGFSALPGGCRAKPAQAGIPEYRDIGFSGYWWSSSEVSFSQNAWFRSLSDPSSYRADFQKWRGFSVRCLRD